MYVFAVFIEADCDEVVPVFGYGASVKVSKIAS